MIEMRAGSKDKTKALLITGGVIIALLAIVAGYFVWQYLALKNDPMAANKETITRITGQIGAVLELPSGEEPKVAQVTDPEKLKGNAFFADVQKDDYMVIYEKAQLAIIYREKTHKLIKVDYVDVSPQQQ